MRKEIYIKTICFLAATFFSGCVNQYKVVVDFSPTLRDHFNEYPTIEVDISAVTDSEADEVKQAGVEKYFAPNSGIRERLQSQTFFFYKEGQNTYMLPSRAPIWKTWLLKKPTNVLVIASLPPDPAMTPQADPRYLMVKMARSFILARNINILVEPKRIFRVTRSSSR